MPVLKLGHATRHNLKDLSVEIPLGRFVCVTGVSGSGKSTLVRDVLLPALEARMQAGAPAAKASDRLGSAAAAGSGEGDDDESPLPTPPAANLNGAEHLGRVVMVDQSSLGRTPRSNPAVYIGAFDDLRQLFAQSDEARQRGLTASAFSFNSTEGQCERCRGAGFEKIEMQFLSDVFIRCPDCNGRRYRAHVLEVKVSSSSRAVPVTNNPKPKTRNPKRAWSIADLLDATVDEAISFLAGLDDLPPARNAGESLKLLQEVGLGYLRLGQPINTLSGGESQRLKLVRHLAEAQGRAGFQPAPAGDPAASEPRDSRKAHSQRGRRDACPTLFLFDEPTTGLHFDDVRVLLRVFQRLAEAGHSVLVIEHNLDVIKCADWILDLGPDAGDDGGRLVAAGTPEDIARCAASHTGAALRDVLCR